MTLANCLRLLKHYEDLSKNAKRSIEKDNANRNYEVMKSHLKISKKGRNLKW